MFGDILSREKDDLISFLVQGLFRKETNFEAYCKNSFLQLYYITLKWAVCAFRLAHFAFVYYLIARNALFIILTRVF